jgi:hypothetical protein
MPWLLEIFVPRLPCACSPNMVIEPTLVRFQEGLIALRKRHGNDLACSVYALNQNLAQFRKYPEITRMLQEVGEKGLPMVFINGVMAFHGEYPDVARLEHAMAKAGQEP